VGFQVVSGCFRLFQVVSGIQGFRDSGIQVDYAVPELLSESGFSGLKDFQDFIIFSFKGFSGFQYFQVDYAVPELPRSG
jgi:hypothetical protein